MRTVPDVKLPDVKPYAGNPHVLAYVVLVVLAFYCIISTMLYLNYVRPDYRALLCLTGCDRETEVLEFFGRDPEKSHFMVLLFALFSCRRLDPYLRFTDPPQAVTGNSASVPPKTAGRLCGISISILYSHLV